MSNVYDLYPRFATLFSGLPLAFGTGAGRWIKRPPRPEDWVSHLSGAGPGIGIAPLREDSTVLFAAIDLDEPDFDAAVEMQDYIPGTSWVETSRSGNAHVWVFFSAAIPAWIPMGVLKEATLAAGKEHVEIFPKNHDFERVRLGNYINLPYHGNSRRIRSPSGGNLELESFLDAAHAQLSAPEDWLRKAEWMQLSSPKDRADRSEFGMQEHLHMCADWVASGAAGPVTEGHRSVVYFNLAKMYTNCILFDHDETVEILRSINAEAGRDSIDDRELLRIIDNAETGQFTSTGCDDPVFSSYAHPDCHIANP